MLRLPGLRIKTTHIMNKDSLEMTAADRESVLQMVEQKLKHPAPVVITHGTDTLVETGLLLQTAFAAPEVSHRPHRRHDTVGIREERWLAEFDGEPAGGALAAAGGIPGDSQPGLPH